MVGVVVVNVVDPEDDVVSWLNVGEVVVKVVVPLVALKVDVADVLVVVKTPLSVTVKLVDPLVEVVVTVSYSVEG